MTKTLKPVIASDFCFILFDIFMQIENKAAFSYRFLFYLWLSSDWQRNVLN